MRRARKYQCLGAVAMLVVVWPVGSAARSQETSPPNELPRSWNLEEIAKQTPPYGAEGRVHVLAWKVMVDDRPLRVESCLVLKVLDTDSDYGRWCLAHLYRHPGEKKPEWRLSMIHVSGEKGTKYFPGLNIMQAKRFKTRPGNKELYAALSIEEVGWTFKQEKGWKFVSCCVCENTWKAAIGETPTRFFGQYAVDDKEPPNRTIKLFFETADKIVKKGTVPKFKLTINNEGKAPEQVIDLSGGRRPDLQDTYYELEVTQDGKMVDLSRAISDPGPIGENDYRKVGAGEKVTFDLTRFATAIEKLPTGRYQARIRFWQDPLQSAKSAFFSPYAEFSVKE